jgi:hypothetical protein
MGLMHTGLVWCNTPSNPWTAGTYSWQLARIIYCLHRPTRVFCAHFVLTHVHPIKLPSRSPIQIAPSHPSQIAPSQAHLTWRFFRDRLPKQKMHLVGMITLLILLSLGLGYHHPRGQDITYDAPSALALQEHIVLRKWSGAPGHRSPVEALSA